MFTGLIEEIGEITSLRPGATGLGLRLRAPEIGRRCEVGESLAVNGLCLTVEQIQSEQLSFHIGQESLQRTTAPHWSVGRRLNLERALTAEARLGGHFVQGHVDGIGSVTEIRPEGETIWLGLSFPPEGAAYLVEKGSLAVDGVSLTIARLGKGELHIAIIPYTWEHTALADLRLGVEVNLEYDILGKYVVRYLQQREESAPEGLTEEFLADHGFC